MDDLSEVPKVTKVTGVTKVRRPCAPAGHFFRALPGTYLAVHFLIAPLAH